MRRLTILLILLLIASAAHAQEESLPVPTVAEYLAAAPAILREARAGTEHPNAFFPVAQTISLELFERYASEMAHADWEQLDTVYCITYSCASSDYRLIDTLRPEWNYAILLSYLHANGVDLDTVGNLEFGRYRIDVTPRDFSGDGQPEYLLDVDSDMFRQLVVMARTEDGGYRVVPSPLAWFGCCFAYWDVTAGFAEEQRFEDMTGDGIPEWVVAVGGYGGGHMNHGYLSILQWQDGTLVDVTSHTDDWSERYRSPEYDSAAGGGAPLIPFGVEIHYVPASRTTTVVITEQYTDNWDCQFSETRIFAWDGSLFSLAERQYEYAETGNCALRDAQAAMWAEDMPEAIRLYEQSRARFAQNAPYTRDNVFNLYAGARLALAYSLSRREREAAALLDALAPVEPTYDFDAVINNLVERMQADYAARPNTLTLCTAMYRVFRNFQQEHGWATYPYWGVTVDTVLPWAAPNGYTNGLDVSQAGCDAPALIEARLAESPFAADVSPMTQLEQRGFSVSASLYDTGGTAGNWLVWLDAPVAPILFTPQGEIYALSRPDVDPPNPYTTFAWRTLPDGTTGLARYEYDTSAPLFDRLPEGAGGPVPYCRGSGDVLDYLPHGTFSMWRVSSAGLERVVRIDLCADIGLEAMFAPGVDTLQGWYGYAEMDTRTYYFMTTYAWDGERYVEQDIPPVPTSSYQPVTTDGSSPYADVRGLMFDALRKRDWQALSDLLQPYLENAVLEDAPEIHYLKALALDMSEQSEAALAQYVAASQYPDSPWGMLAALHVRLDEVS